MTGIYRTIEDVPLFRYGMIMADPPWSFRTYSQEGQKKGAASQYRVMDLDAIKALPVNQLAQRDCLLWLWATHPMLPQAIETVDAWGFTFITSGVWVKRGQESGKLAFGNGYWLRCASEPFILAKVGKPKIGARNVRTVIESSRGRHSAKPDEAFEEAERLAHHFHRIELFSRSPREGWDVMGDEIAA